MPRAKHGQYDAAKRLPDNTGRPQGSGTITWLHAEVRARLGDEAGALIEQSRAQGSQQTPWLTEQLTKQGHSDLVDAYKQRRRQESARARIRDKERTIAMCEATIDRNDTPPEHQAFLRKAIAKAQKYLEAHADDGG